MVRARRLLTTSILSALVVASTPGCDAGAGPAPEDSVAITGSVIDAAGAAVVGATASARTALTPQQIDSSRLNELDELGFACIDERPPSACHDHRKSGATGAAGEFSLVFGVLEALGGGPAVITSPQPMTIAVVLAPGAGELSGAAASQRIIPDAAGAPVETFVMWQPALALETINGSDAVLRWDRAPVGEIDEYQVFVEDSSGRLVWQEATTAREMVLKLPNLSGTRGGVSVVALAPDRTHHWRSARIPYRADGGMVRPAPVDDVDWPTGAGLPAPVVLVAIVAILLANVLLVGVSGHRHRQHLATIPVRRHRRRRR